MWFCRLPRSQFPLKSHSNMKKKEYFHLMGWTHPNTHHSQCMEFVMQFWWMTIFLRSIFFLFFLFCCLLVERKFELHKYFWREIVCVSGTVCLWHSTRIYTKVLTHSVTTQKITPRQLFNSPPLLQPLRKWLMNKSKAMQFLNCDEELFLIFVIYWLSNYRAARAIKRTYIYLLNFINENYKY